MYRHVAGVRTIRMIEDILGEKPCLIVAHPDDEVLWAGGLVLTNKDLEWTAVCCSIPRIDPERAWLWHEACHRLGITKTWLMPVQEPHPGKGMGSVPLMQGFTSYVTHGFSGEYGHLHHRQVHSVVKFQADAPVMCFNIESGDFEITLSDEIYGAKLNALQAYAHHAPYPYLDNVPKWKALIHRYAEMEGVNFRREGFDLMPEKYQWHVIEHFVNKHGYKTGAELGVRWGQTSRYLMDNLKGHKIIGVDLMQVNNDADVSRGQETYETWDWQGYEDQVKSIENDYPEAFNMLRMDTGEAAKQVENGSLDWIFIDADHSYEGVLRDIKNWTPKVRKGGMVIGHDIDRPGIRQAVKESFDEWDTMEKKWNNCWWHYVEH